MLYRLFSLAIGHTMWDYYEEGDVVVSGVNDAWPNDDKTIYQVARYSWTILCIIGLILNILCFKWRSIARAFLPLELLNFILINAIPWEGCSMDRFSYGCKTLCLGIFFYCDIQVGLITLLIAGVAQIWLKILKR